MGQKRNKMDNRGYILGLDTSNYRTSIAVVDTDGSIVIDQRTLLKVKKGERGLRQSEALFQHVENLPELFEVLAGETFQLSAVAASNKPRPIEGSYMPCFKAGYGFGKAIANTFHVPFFVFSHQEGHVEAVKHFSSMDQEDSLLVWHLSGGTCELLRVQDREIEIVGGSKDISFGQVIDRVGVLLGMNFPAGEEMDQRALQGKLSAEPGRKLLSPIRLDGLTFNLSGIETQCSRLLQSSEQKNHELNENFLIRELFDRIAETILNVSLRAAEQFGIKHILFAGGVSSSRFIRDKIKNSAEGNAIQAEFGRPELSGDNAVGIALLGRKSLWP